MEFTSIDPATEERLSSWPVASPEERRRILGRGAEAARAFRGSSVDERAALLTAVGVELRRRREDLALLATREMGKPLAEALAEVDKCAAGCDWFAAHGPAMVADEPVEIDDATAYVSYLPLGLILAIMPWNFPYWQVFRHMAPAVIAGNAIVVKHAENTLGVAHAIVEVFRAAGAPEGLISTVVCTVEEAREVIESDEVAAVTLTGSTGAGSKVAAIAGGVWKKTVLELGGSDAFVVLEDADVEQAAAVAVRSRFQNTGQSCIAAKRFIVVEQVADAFTDAFVAHTRELVVGDPTKDGTTLGPIARGDLRDQLTRTLHDALDAGATPLLEGGPRDGAGFFFDPAVLAVTDPQNPAWRRETFGPVAPIMRVPDEAAALAAANDSDYGLGGNVWTRDIARGSAFARRLESGACFVNGMTASMPALPFGGIKRSGYGRELASFGVREFTDVQSVWVGTGR